MARKAKKDALVINEAEFLYWKIKTLAEGLTAMGIGFPDVPLYIKNNLSGKFEIRKYQEEASRL